MTINIAVIGLGWVSTHRHIPSILESGKFQLIGIADWSSSKVEAVSRRLQVKQHASTDNLAAIPWLAEADAVSIATPPDTHYTLIRQAILLKKHVLTEKPFCMSEAEALELRDLAKANGVQLSIVHNFQFASSMQKLERALAEGKIGEITGISATQFSNPNRRLPIWYEQLPLGLFYDESPHLLYILQRISRGDIELARADIHRNSIGANTPAQILAQYLGRSNGKRYPITLKMNFECAISEWHLTVLGTKGTADIDLFRDIFIHLPDDEDHNTRTVLRTSLYATVQHWAQHFTSGLSHIAGKLKYGNDHVFERFANAVNNGVADEYIGADNALSVLRMQHEIISKAHYHETSGY